MDTLFVFLSANWSSLLVGAFLVLICYLLLKNGYQQKVAMICLFLVNKAEEKFGAGAGEIKYEWVLAHLYPSLPKVVRFFLSEDEIDNTIERAVDQLQEWLEEESRK